MTEAAQPSGFLELISPAFALGWARHAPHGPAYIAAMLGDEILGIARAETPRADLAQLQETGRPAGSFIVLFNRELDTADLTRVALHRLDDHSALPPIAELRFDSSPIRRIFVLGSPRSGTSELGATLQRVYDLPWMGEFHGAPLFAAPAAAIQQEMSKDDDLSHFIGAYRLDESILRLARLTYFGVHGSASFIDKTPGVPMIAAAPFLARCFPDAKFIYLRRNGVSNVLSRMAKFGGDFSEHCADWAAALTEWERVRALLPHYLELRQEDMQNNPTETASRIAEYIGTPDTAPALAASLSSGRLERTGAGIGRTRLADTGWGPLQIQRFIDVCGPAMERFGYEM